MDDLTFTRRTALALLGTGGFGVAADGAAAQSDGGSGRGARPWNQDVDARGHDLLNLNAIDVDHVYTAARDADVVVWKDEDGVFHADGRDGHVASGERVLAVTQAAVDSLSEGRTSKEKVLVASPGEIYGDDDPVEIPSYTVLDVPVTLTAPEGEDAPTVVTATGADRIEIESLVVDGPAERGVMFVSCSNVRLGDLWLRGVRSQGVRIEGKGDDPRTTDVQISRVYVEKSGHHGIETYGVDRIQIGQVIGIDPESCVVLLNDTTDATINSIVGEEPGVPAGYATFRVANGAHDITVGEVVSRGGARGIFGVSACSEITIGEVNIVGARDHGILIQDCQNFTVEGGVVKNCENEAIRVDSRDSYGHPPAEGVSLSNLRVFDDREEPQQTYGIYETGPHTKNNRFVNNDLRGAGTEANLSVFAESTVVDGNLAGGVDAGTVTLSGGSSPAARVEGVTDRKGATLSLREKAFEAPDAAFSWEHYFEWNGSAWDLVFEWRTDPGEDVTLDYIVDKPQANLGRETGYPGEGGTPDPLTEGTYRMTAYHSRKVAEAADGSTEAGTNVRQWEWTGADHQQWRAVALDDGENVFRLEAVHGDGDAVMEVADGSTDDGANVQLGSWEGADHQKWRVEPARDGSYSVRAVHSEQALNVAGVSTDDGANIVQWPYGGGAGNEIWMFESP